MSKPVFKDSQQAFSEAILAGRLSAEPTNPLYAGHYMYIGTWEGQDAFKHFDTRRYLSSVKAEGESN